jgi:hypothetical protein
MADNSFAVVQARLERLDPELVEQALIAGAGFPKADASRAARRNRGFLAQRISQAQAEGVARVLQQSGCAVRVLPMSSLAEIGKPISVTHLTFQPQSLGVPLGMQQVLLDVPWTGVFVINAGHLSVIEQKHREVDSGIDLRGRPVIETKTTQHSERHPALEVIGVSSAGSMVYLRLLSVRMQGNKIPGVPPELPRHMQFFFVLEQLVRLATAAFVSPETRKMLADRKVDRSKSEGSLQFEADERAFTDYSRWLLQLVMFRESGAPA